MEIISLKNLDNLSNEKKYYQVINLNKLINELRKRDLPNNVIEEINLEIEKANKETMTTDIFKQVFISSHNIIRMLEKQLKLVPKKYYQRRYLAMGIVFGMTYGSGVGASLNNPVLMISGIPVGIMFGIIIGTGKDNKALKDGRQLDVDMNYKEGK